MEGATFPGGQDAFMAAYKQFWASQGKEVPQCTVRWQTEPIDVFALHKEVEKLGGSKTVREKNLWRTVGDAFNPPSECVKTRSFAPSLSRTGQNAESRHLHHRRFQHCELPGQESI